VTKRSLQHRVPLPGQQQGEAARRHVLHENSCYNMPMGKKTNITLKLDADLLRAAKVLATKKGTSVSALVTLKLGEMVKEADEYEQAKKRAIARMKQGWDLGWQRPKSRDELHER
jgi:hypothetical protein